MATPLNQLIGQPLTWIPTAMFKTRYSLVTADNMTLATLDMSSWRAKANAEIPEGSLFIHTEGWSGRKVAIHAFENGPLIARYEGKWTGSSGKLGLPDGREFQWSKANFWGTQKAWTDPASSSPYVQLSKRSFSRKSNVILYPQAAALPELSLLVVLGLYNIIVEQRNQAAASSTTATMS